MSRAPSSFGAASPSATTVSAVPISAGARHSASWHRPLAWPSRLVVAAACVAGCLACTAPGATGDQTTAPLDSTTTAATTVTLPATTPSSTSLPSTTAPPGPVPSTSSDDATPSNDTVPGATSETSPPTPSTENTAETSALMTESAPSSNLSSEDAGVPCEPFVMPEDCVIPEGLVLPSELRCTGLYGDWATRSLHCGITEYEPAYTLWSDGLFKRRFVSLPAGAQVNVTKPDDFRYPVGTKFWKEFGFEREDGSVQLAETRLLERVQIGWLYTSYVWDEAGTNALQENEGVIDWNGTGHSVPSRNQCKECHAGRKDFVLGWDGILLGAGAKGITRDTLLAQGLITWTDRDTGAPNPLTQVIPGDAVEQAALGYLHTNCGVSCHNDTSAALALETGFFTRLDADTLTSVQTTDTFATGVNRTPNPNAPISGLPPDPESGPYVDIRPLDLDRSLTSVRMKLRDVESAMPRLGTNKVDSQGVAIIEAWIASMTTERGYPDPDSAEPR